MSTSQLLQTAWVWHPLVLAGGALGLACYGLLLFYARKHAIKSPILWRRAFFFSAGLLVGVLALVSPVEALADGYLFSAHMLQHLLMLLIVPPLLLLSLPVFQLPATPSPKVWSRVGRFLTWPMLTWVAGASAMWVWHAPTLCNAASGNALVHGFQVFTLILMGGLFWWPICGPQRSQRLPTMTGVLYLFSACLACTFLGILITFSPLEVCSVYLHPNDSLGILPLLRDGWGLTPGVDQKIGGLLMWVPACVLYLTAIMAMLLRWFSASYVEQHLPVVPETPSQARSQSASPEQTAESK